MGALTAHQCDECTSAFASPHGLATHIGRVHRGGRPRPNHLSALFLAGIALPFARNEGEQLPCDGLIEVFFADYTRRSDYRRKTATAIELCQACLRKQECFDGAWARQEPAGVWGGVDFSTHFAPHLRRPARAS